MHHVIKGSSPEPWLFLSEWLNFSPRMKPFEVVVLSRTERTTAGGAARPNVPPMGEPRQHRPSVEASTIKEEDKQAGSKEAEGQELKTKEARNKPTESSTQQGAAVAAGRGRYFFIAPYRLKSLAPFSLCLSIC